MGLLTKMKNPKAIYAHGNKLKKIMCMDTQIWSGAVKITFIEGKTSTTVEYDEGATVNRATAPSGATFVGWSTSPNGSNPSKTFTATQDMTVYRVIKYSTQTASCSAWTAGGNDRSTTFTVNSSTHYTSATCSISGGTNAQDGGSAIVQLNGKTLFGSDDPKFNTSRNCTVVNGINTLRCYVDTWTGDISATISIPGKQVVG